MLITNNLNSDATRHLPATMGFPAYVVNNKESRQARGGGALPYMGYIGMCRCEGYGFQAVYSRIGYINQSV